MLAFSPSKLYNESKVIFILIIVKYIIRFFLVVEATIIREGQPVTEPVEVTGESVKFLYSGC